MGTRTVERETAGLAERDALPRRPRGAHARVVLGRLALGALGWAVLAPMAPAFVPEGAARSTVERCISEPVRDGWSWAIGWTRGPTCCGGDETSAIVTLRSLHSAQTRFQDAAIIDLDRDGVGEFGSLSEMSGGVAVRGSDACEAGCRKHVHRTGDAAEPCIRRPNSCSPHRAVEGAVRSALLSGVFRNADRFGVVMRSGFSFRVYLIDSEGSPVSPDCRGMTSDRVTADSGESRWIAYAWPNNPSGEYANRTFAVDQTGSISWTRNSAYLGSRFGPPAGAALGGGGFDAAGGALVTAGVGQDGATWTDAY